MSVAVPLPGGRRRSAGIGLLSAGGLAAAYSLIVGVSSRSWSHLLSQWRADLWLIVPVAAGFGAQMALYTYVRRTIRGDGTGAAVAAGGTATSTAAMVACCLHHLTDVVPFIGLSAAATFLVRYRLSVVVLSLAASAAGILLMLRALRHARRAPAACHEGSSRGDNDDRETRTAPILS